MSCVRNQASVAKHVCKLVGSMSVRDASCLSAQMWSNVYWFRDGIVEHPKPSSNIPWPVIYLLTRYNKKHIFNRQAYVDPSSIAKPLADFGNKLQWKCKFRNEQVVEDNELLRKLPKKQSTTRFFGMHCPELDAFCGQIRVALNQHIERVGKAKTLPYVVARALKSLELGSLAAVATDKDGGFMVCSKSDVARAHEAILCGSEYSQCILPSRISVCKEYNRICKDLEETFDVPGLRNRLTVAFGANVELCTHLHVTAKTHKYFEKGVLKWRNLHAVGKWVFRALSVFVGLVLDNALKELCPHLLRDTLEVINRLKGLSMPCGAKFASADVDSFFMSGKAHELVQLLGPPFWGKRLIVLKHAVFFLLDNQYVCSRFLPGKTWKVVVGSGMGLPHSGPLADMCLYVAAERVLLAKERMERASIMEFLRFKDDVLILYRNTDAFKEWFWEYKFKSMPFAITCDSVSSVCVEYLESCIRNEGGALVFEPRVRGSKLAAPVLDVSSMHQPSIHSNWPKGFLLRRLQLCSSKSIMEEEKRRVLGKFVGSAAPHYIVSKLASMDVKQVRYDSNKSCHRRSRDDAGHDHVAKVVRLILPWHPSLKGVPKAIRKTTSSHKYLLDMVFGMHKSPSISVTWKNGQRNLSSVIQSLATHTSKGSELRWGSGEVGGINIM